MATAGHKWRCGGFAAASEPADTIDMMQKPKQMYGCGGVAQEVLPVMHGCAQHLAAGIGVIGFGGGSACHMIRKDFVITCSGCPADSSTAGTHTSLLQCMA